MQYAAETPRLWLERLGEKHLEDSHKIWSSEETMIWSQRLPHETLEQTQAWMQTGMSPDTKIDKFAIILRPDTSSDRVDQNAREDEELKMIGVIGTVTEGKELAYMLHCDYWRKGYMSEALRAFIGQNGLFWALDNRKDVQTLAAQIDAENIPSMKTIAKLGGREGERKVKAYGLGRDIGEDGKVPESKKRDFICWYIDRPQVSHT